MSLFDRAENTNITNSQINTNNIQIIQSRSTGAPEKIMDTQSLKLTSTYLKPGLIVLGQNSALGGIYNSLERQQLDAPKCHPNTRKAVIKRIIDWIREPMDSEILILWLYGAAGAGKSAIAHTLAEICENRGWLVASFFFWKSAGERNNVNRFVATIAHQVALAIPTSRELIGATVDYNPFIFQQSVDVQLCKLVVEPLRQLFSAGKMTDISPLVVVIDGLDECQGAETQSGLIKSLAAAFREFPFRIRIIISSRPEVYLQTTFNSSSVRPRLTRLPLSDEYAPEEDIRQFLKDSFERIRHEHPLASYIPSSWPSSNILHELTEKSSGQFIFASTTVKYIGGNPHQLPHRRLDVVCRLQPPDSEQDMPYAELNSLYHHVLSNVDNMETVKLVLGVLIALNSVLGSVLNRINTTEEIDNFFFWQPGKTEACLSQLASIIKLDACYKKISLLHTSLSDFLLDPSRSRQFYLCRESILGDCAAFGLCHLRQQAVLDNGVSLLFFLKFILGALIYSTSYSSL